MLRQLVVCILTLVLGAGLALAHGDYTHLMGTVTAVGADTVTIKDTAGKSLVVNLSKTIKYLQNKKEVTKDDLKLGTRVVIDAKMDEKTKKYTADEVTIGAAKAAAQK